MFNFGDDNSLVTVRTEGSTAGSEVDIQASPLETTTVMAAPTGQVPDNKELTQVSMISHVSDIKSVVTALHMAIKS